MPDARYRLLCAALALLTLPLAAHAAATTWAVDPGRSTLTFETTQQGEKFTGSFGKFQALVQFDEKDIADSKLEVTIDVRSADTHSRDRDQALASGDWFDVAHQPTATFRTVAMRMTGQGPTADADLTIKGKTQRVAFPFRFAVNGSDATLDGHVTLNRLDYGLGGGEWADDSVVGRKVEVTTHLVLHAAPAK
jgi:polyisoprenoid-binding protein YceI